MRSLAYPLAVLMLLPTRSHASTIQTGVGYVVGECRSIGDSDEKACFTGERFDLGLNIAVKNTDDPEKPAPKAAPKSSGSARRGGGGWSGTGNFSLGPKGDAFVLAVILVVLIVYGLYWGIVTLFSHKISMGLYASFDFQKAKLEGDSDFQVEKYHSQSTGLQTIFYLVRDSDFALNVGAAGTTAQIKTSTAAEGDKSYHLRGISSKAGIGYMPFERSGVYAMLEWEGTYFDGTSVAKYVRADSADKVPKLHRSGAFILGLAF